MPTLNVNGVNLYYELHGPEMAPVLVLNNGIIMNAATSWFFQTRVLSKEYRLLQYDCRGQGQSDHPEIPYSMEGHADDLFGLLDALGIEKAHIAGISYGGEVAQAFALKYPAKVRSLILIDTVSEVGPEVRLVVQSWVDALRVGDALAFFNATVSWNFSPEFIANNSTLLEDAKKRYAALDFAAIIRLCEAFFEVDFTKRLGEIKVPTCIMVGELDLLKGIRYAEVLKRNIPHAEYHVLMGAGHASCWERPQEFNSIVLGFLAKQP
ncbi:MAG TPA: alpha/beta fold hydrolase [Anaerolineales bacterium]|nr:alpha/beta fold hydrolase [Anaerolineales bacterium]